MKIEKSIANKIILSIVLVAILFLISFAPVKIAYAADTVSSSNVLDDLSSDSKFSAENYLSNQSDYSLQIITIAESKDNELLLYVYQPATRQDFRANYISMSTTLNNSINPDIYSLSYCNHSGTLYKYKVNDFVVSSGEVRFYEIYSIFRPFVEGIDTPTTLNQTVNAVSFSVSKSWELGEINGKSFIECADIQTIEIDKKFVGFVRYAHSDEYDRLGIFGLPYGFPVDSHFVAFTTDYNIDELLEADVYYQQQQSVWDKNNLPDGYFGEIEPHKVTVRSTDEASFDSNGWYSYGHFEWKRIQTVSEFLSSSESSNVYKAGLFNVRTQTAITDEVKKELSSYQWVLRFSETEWLQQSNIYGKYMDRHEIVSNVSILRLKFVTAGITYNLGVIDNMQSGSQVNINDTIFEMSETLKLILGIIGFILFLIIIVVICNVVKPIGDFLKFIFKLIWSIITAPFRFISWLFGGSKKRSKSYKKYRRR